MPFRILMQKKKTHLKVKRNYERLAFQEMTVQLDKYTSWCDLKSLSLVGLDNIKKKKKIVYLNIFSHFAINTFPFALDKIKKAFLALMKNLFTANQH